jgi:hypothetical protein
MLKEPTHRHKTDKFGNGQRAPYMMMMSHPPAENKNKTRLDLARSNRNNR